MQVAADLLGVGVHEPVVQPLVVAVVEAELLELPLEIPVGLGDEQHLRVDARAPEITSDQYSASGGRTDAVAPGAPEDVVEHQHRHVATHTVGQVPDLDERVDRGLPKSGRKSVELRHVRPRWEVRDRGRVR